MTLRPILSFSLLLAAFAISAPARAEGPSKFVTRLMGQTPGQGKTFACFTTSYDDAHLASHPKQNVRAMTILAVAYANMDYDTQLRMGFQFRGRAEEFTTVAECGHSGGSGQSAFCAGPSEGGRTRIAVENARTALVTLPVGIALWKPGPANPQDTVRGAFGADDKVFRLQRTALSQCASQAIDDEEKALLQRPQ